MPSAPKVQGMAPLPFLVSLHHGYCSGSVAIASPPSLDTDIRGSRSRLRGGSSGQAGVQGVEPWLAVLETAVLP